MSVIRTDIENSTRKVLQGIFPDYSSQLIGAPFCPSCEEGSSDLLWEAVRRGGGLSIFSHGLG
jgi:hypothetical protein